MSVTDCKGHVEACSDLRELYRREDVLCVQCDVTDQRKMVRLSRARGL